MLTQDEARKPLALATLRFARAIFRQALGAAVYPAKTLARNPHDGVKLPKAND